jgi:neprosin-like protein
MKNRMFCKPIQRLQENVTRKTHPAIFNIVLVLFMLNALISAQSRPTPKEFVSFRDFIDRTTTADSSEYLARSASRVKDAAAFEEMRQHILTMYQGVEVYHSFVLDSSHYDCVPIEQQPAVRKYGIKKIASPPPQSTLNKPASGGDEASSTKPASQLDPEKPFDEFGNSVHCEEHTVPMRRVTLETMTHFPTLRQFFQKSPDGAEQVPGQKNGISSGKGYNLPGTGLAHKYSETVQNVNNLGGNSNLNLWSPYVNTSAGEVFSLSQEWYVGGINTGVPLCGGPQSCSIQTEEVGWIVYPAMFGDERPHFFIYSTPDGYATGCWNNTCRDFVQVADSGILGASFSYSTSGGTQQEISAEYHLYQGNWWLAYQGTWIGYYPGSMYHGGQNTRYAQSIAFGTEGVGSTIWPPEGSGAWASAGFGYAAYQRNLWYFNTSAGRVWDSLSRVESSPTCYTISGPYSSSSTGWARYFYEGGPGGFGC